MNFKPFLGCLCAMGLLGVALPTYSEALSQPDVSLTQVQTVIYSPETGELRIENEQGQPLTAEKPEHHPRRKNIEFYIPKATVQPTPKVVTVPKDPVVKSIQLEQRALSGVPAVRVLVNLYTNSPFVPFSLTPATPGLKLVFTRTLDSPSSAQATIAAQSTPQAYLLQGETPSSQPSTLTIDPTQATLRFRAAEATPQGMVNTVVGPVDESAYSVIDDIFYENNQLTVVSQKTPIQIQRSFLLNEPNRYVIDLSPAVLSSRSLLNRAVPQNNPGIRQVKAGQFDEKTVRLVVQFNQGIQPVDMSQLENNRILKLGF